MCATSCQRLPYQPYPYYDSALQPPVSVFHQYTAHTAFQSGPAPASLLPVEHVAKVSAWRWSAPVSSAAAGSYQVRIISYY